MTLSRLAADLRVVVGAVFVVAALSSLSKPVAHTWISVVRAIVQLFCLLPNCFATCNEPSVVLFSSLFATVAARSLAGSSPTHLFVVARSLAFFSTKVARRVCNIQPTKLSIFFVSLSGRATNTLK